MNKDFLKPQSTSFWQWGRLGQKSLPKPRLLFGQMWEDPSMELEILKSIPNPERICVVASSGCTALSLAAHTSAQILAIDINEAQIYFCRLKSLLLQSLDYEEFLSAIDKEAQSFYKMVETSLDAETQYYWAENQWTLQKGLNHAGLIDRRMTLFASLFVWFTTSPKIFLSFLNLTDTNKQKALFAKTFHEKRLQTVMNMLLNRRVLRWVFGRHIVNQLPQNFAQHIFLKLRSWFTNSPIYVNPYIWQTFLKRYNYTQDRALPIYLQKEVYKKIKQNVSNIRWVASNMMVYLNNQPAHSIHFFVISNILEAMDQLFSRQLLLAIQHAAHPNALVVFRYIALDPQPMIEENLNFKLITDQLSLEGILDRSGICNSVRVYTIEPAIQKTP